MDGQVSKTGISISGYEPDHLSYSTIDGLKTCEGCGWLNGQPFAPDHMRWFFAKGEVTITETGCYEWGAKLQSNGYGWVWHGEKKRSYLAHRWSWELANDAEIPDGMVIMHECDNPPCVNPAHLELGTYSQNTKDAITRGLRVFNKKTHCPSGHRYTDDNIYYRPNGERMCRACVLARGQRRRDRDNGNDRD